MKLLPRARVTDVARGRAALVGARCSEEPPRGVISPVEARLLMGIPYGDLEAEEARYLRSPDRSRRGDAAVVAKALLALAMAPDPTAQAAPRPRIVSAHVDNTTVDAALESIFAPSRGDGARMVHFAHAHALNLAAFDRGFAELLDRAHLVLPDGVGIRVGARLVGVAMVHNINGTDLLPPLCRRAVEEGIPMALVGGAEGVARECADNLLRNHAGLEIPYVSQGYLDAGESRQVAESIRALGRCVVLVGMGSPRQERWAWEHLSGLDEATIITVGGLFDFFSERIPRAPMGWRELGLEWLYRMLQEPGRLGKRYLLGNPLFLSLALAQRARSGRQ